MDSTPSWSGLWQHPIFQAPMAGGADTPALTVSESDDPRFCDLGFSDLDFMGTAYLSPQPALSTSQLTAAASHCEVSLTTRSPRDDDG